MINNYKSAILIYPVILILSFLVLSNEPAIAQKGIEPSIMIEDFYPVQRGALERAWQQVSGQAYINLPHIRDIAKRYNLHPADVATVFIADAASRYAWPGGLPNEIPFGFVHSQTGLTQIPPGMAASIRLMDSRLIVPGARARFKRMRESTLQPEKGVDYWFKALSDESYDAMKDPKVNMTVATRYLRRVADEAYNLYMPDARESLMLKDKSIIPDNKIRWADEYDWGKLKKYLRNHMLWNQSYEFDIAQFKPSDKRLSELNLMILYSEYRTAPPFDDSWFFEGMYLIREARRWVNSREDILEELKPSNGKVIPFIEYVEDYSYYQNEFEMLNPGRVVPTVRDSENSGEEDNTKKKEDKDKSSDKSKDDKSKGKRKSRGKYG